MRSSRSSSQVDDSTGRLQGHTTLHDMSNSFFLISASLSRSLSTNTYICLSIYLSTSLSLSLYLSLAPSILPSLFVFLCLFIPSLSISFSVPLLSLSLFLSFFSLPLHSCSSVSLSVSHSHFLCPSFRLSFSQLILLLCEGFRA